MTRYINPFHGFLFKLGLPTPSSQAASRRESLDEKGLGRKNRAFLAVKHELAEREKNKKKRMKAAKKGKLKENPMDEVGMNVICPT